MFSFSKQYFRSIGPGKFPGYSRNMKTTGNKLNIVVASEGIPSTNGMRHQPAAYSLMKGDTQVGRLSNTGRGWVCRDYRTGSTEIAFRSSTLAVAKKTARLHFA